MKTTEAIEAVIKEDGIDSAVEWIAGVVDEKHSRIEQLEAALREIACDGEDCDCQAPQYCSYGIARAALGEKKDD
jgi:hypothetical protein